MVTLKKQNQHELPEKYLEAFCAPASSHVWVFRRGGTYSPSITRGKGNPFRSGIHQTAASVNRYAGRRLDGTFDVDGWENRLQVREHAVDLILTKIRNREVIDDEEKRALADYLILMHLRVRKRWADAEKRARVHVSKRDLDDLARELAFGGRFKAARQVRDATEFLRSNAGVKNLLLESMGQEMSSMRSAVIGMTWNFVCAPPGAFFVTCDAPFIFDETIGLGRSFFQFPISPAIMLIAAHRDSPRKPFEVASPDEALKLNWITMFSAHREVYAPSPSEWIHNAWNYGIVFDAQGGHINSPNPDGA